jgi:thiol-disulfide isomerase/thioredoxin
MNKTKMSLLTTLLLCTFITSFGQTKYLKYNIKDQKKANKLIGAIITSPLKNIDNKTVSLENYNGKFIVVDFWFTKCYPCFREFPFMDSIRDLFKENNNLLFINLCSESSIEEWKKVLIEKQMSGINLFDDNIKITKTSIIGAPKSTGKGIIHDQLFLSGYPSYAFIDLSGKVLGATPVAPSNKLLFAYYIEGLLNNKNIDESLNIFISELKAEKISAKFLNFIQRRFNINESDAYKLIEPYKSFF